MLLSKSRFKEDGKIYIGCHFHDPDSSLKIVLLKMNAQAFETGSFADTLYRALQGEENISGLFTSCVQAGSDWKRDANAVHLYLFNLAQRQPNLHVRVIAELQVLLGKRTVIYNEGKTASFTAQNIGWLVIEMAYHRGQLDNDCWG